MISFFSAPCNYPCLPELLSMQSAYLQYKSERIIMEISIELFIHYFPQVREEHRKGISMRNSWERCFDLFSQKPCFKREKARYPQKTLEKQFPLSLSSTIQYSYWGHGSPTICNRIFYFKNHDIQILSGLKWKMKITT